MCIKLNKKRLEEAKQVISSSINNIRGIREDFNDQVNKIPGLFADCPIDASSEIEDLKKQSKKLYQEVLKREADISVFIGDINRRFEDVEKKAVIEMGDARYDELRKFLDSKYDYHNSNTPMSINFAPAIGGAASVSVITNPTKTPTSTTGTTPATGATVSKKPTSVVQAKKPTSNTAATVAAGGATSTIVSQASDNVLKKKKETLENKKPGNITDRTTDTLKPPKPEIVDISKNPDPNKMPTAGDTSNNQKPPTNNNNNNTGNINNKPEDKTPDVPPQTNTNNQNQTPTPAQPVASNNNNKPSTSFGYNSKNNKQTFTQNAAPVSDAPASNQPSQKITETLTQEKDLFDANLDDFYADLEEGTDNIGTDRTTGGSGLGAIAAGIGVAAAAGIGAKIYKDRKENNEFDIDEDSPTNGNKFWSNDEQSVIHSEKEEYLDEKIPTKEENYETLTEDTTYSAKSNNYEEKDTWDIVEETNNSELTDLLGNN